MSVSYPPRFGDDGPRLGVKTVPHRFDVLPTIDGFQVIDFDGRPVQDEAVEIQARDLARQLNEAAHGGYSPMAVLDERTGGTR